MMKKTIKMALLLVVSFTIGCSPAGEKTTRQPKDQVPEEFVGQAPPPASLTEFTGNSKLDRAALAFLKSYGPTIKKYSKQYGLDWRLVLAVMKQESGFSSEAESQMGASGLMQVMPETGQEIAEHLNLEDLEFPQDNIHGGVFYLRKLYNLFPDADEGNRIRLALAAYNAGLGRIYDAQQVARYFDESPASWESVRGALPLLSRRYSTLHCDVFDEVRPTSGYFGNSQETLAYVDKVMGYYDDYCLLLN